MRASRHQLLFSNRLLTRELSERPFGRLLPGIAREDCQPQNFYMSVSCTELGCSAPFPGKTACIARPDGAADYFFMLAVNKIPF